jgi:spore maturation protein CgeB
MRVLYIGQYGKGSTSRMRGECLQEILAPASFEVIDLDEPIHNAPRAFRSLGWRYNIGPLIGDVSRFVHERLNGVYDLAWIDKGVFIGPGVLGAIKANVKVHYTPDTAIVFNKSRQFFGSIPLYDYCITTKSFEIEDFKKKGAREVLFCTQGYDARVHRPRVPVEEKSGIVFVGRCEPSREQLVAKLLEKKAPVTLAGANWEKFVRKYRNNPSLTYFGPGLYGDSYADIISRSQLGLGLVSKLFPERHTTRTLEMPACGTALATERNEDTLSIFSEEEVFFYRDTQELVEAVPALLADPDKLNRIAEAGYRRVTQGGFDYLSILRNLLSKMNIHAESV